MTYAAIIAYGIFAFWVGTVVGRIMEQGRD